MLDACTARRANGNEAQDEDAGTVVPLFDDLFDSPCKIQERGVIALNSEVGERTATTMRLELHLPATSDELAAGDIVEVTSIHPLSIATVGDKLRVSGPVGKTWATARRYEVTKVVS